jgi:ABC-2 type transport system permease protein
MNIFMVLLRKEIKELLTRQLLFSIAAMILVFYVIGKSVGSHSRASGASNSIVVMDLDRSELSARLLAAMGGGKTPLKPSAFTDIESAMSAPEHSGESSFLVIPAGLARSVEEGRPSRLEFYSRFRKRASGLGAAMAASRIRKVSSLAAAEASSYALERKAPGLPPSFLRDPAPAVEFVVVDGRTERVPLAQVVGFMQSQSYFFPIAVFFIVILSAQMIMTAIATEKENKTLETLLSSPLDRRMLVVSKLTAAAIIAAGLSGAYLLGMRSFMSGITAAAEGATAAAAGPALAKLGLVITTQGYLLIGLSVLVCILCSLSLAFILGMLAEDVKSIQAMLVPLMMPLMLSYLMPIFIDLSTAGWGIKGLLYAIPFTHAFLAPRAVMTGDIASVVWGIIYQAAVFAVFVTLAARLFSGDALLTLRLRLPGTRRKAAAQ